MALTGLYWWWRRRAHLRAVAAGQATIRQLANSPLCRGKSRGNFIESAPVWSTFLLNRSAPPDPVGVMGDGRTYDHVCALRAVTSTDGMTADYYPFPHEFLGRAATRIINEVKSINRVAHDEQAKARSSGSKGNQDSSPFA